MKIRVLTVIALAAMAGAASAAFIIPDGDFENADHTATWTQANGGSAAVFSYPTTGGNGGGYGQIEEPGGGWAVLVSPATAGDAGGGVPIASIGVTPGTTATFTIDLKTFAGAAAGGMKVEAWGANALLGNSGDVNAPASLADGNWNTFTFDWGVPAGTDKMIFVPLWGAASTVGYDNIGVVPEPATIGLVGIFGAGLLFTRRRLKN